MRRSIGGVAGVLGMVGMVSVLAGQGPNLVEAALHGPLRESGYLTFVVRPPHEDWRPGTEPNNGKRDADAELRNEVLCRLNLRTGQREVMMEGESSELERRLGQRRIGDPVRRMPPGLFEAGSGMGLSLLHGRTVPGGDARVVVAVPGSAVTREKGWLALVEPGETLDGPERIRLLGTESGRLDQALAAMSELPMGEPPIYVEHPEFCWRYPYPMSEELFLALTDRAIWLVDAEGRAEMLYSEQELEGELAFVQPEVAER